MPTEDAIRAAIVAALPASSPGTVYGRKLRRLVLAALDAPTGQALHDAAFELSHAAGDEHCHPGSPFAQRAAAERDQLADPAYRAVCSSSSRPRCRS